MLDANALDLHYGAAQALRAVSIKAEPGKVTCVLGRNGVGKTSLPRRAGWPASRVARHHSMGRQRHHGFAAGGTRAAWHRLCAARP